MAKSKRKRKKKNSSNFSNEVQAIIIISFGLLSIFSLHTDSVGKVGFIIKNLLFGMFSTPAFVIPYLIVLYGFFSLDKSLSKLKNKFLYCSTALFSFLLIIYTLVNREHLPDDIINYDNLKLVYLFGANYHGGGGIIGSLLASLFIYFFGVKGSYIVVSTLIFLSIMLVTNISLKEIITILLNSLKNAYKTIIKFVSNNFSTPKLSSDLVKGSKKEKAKVNDDTNNNLVNEDVDEKIKILDYTSTNQKSTIEKENNNSIDINDQIQTKEENLNEETVLKVNTDSSLKDYQLPSLSLLNQNNSNNNTKNKKDILNKAKTLEKTLDNFGVEAKVVQISKGPTITRFEIQPSPGVKVSKIVNLTDDIALNLAAQNIRIEAPIPGKSAVGIEVPNSNPMLVSFREVIESKEFVNSSSKLTYILGKNISGNPIVSDLSKMPHMLIAGATGSGKSVCVNTLINSILYKASPEEVKFLLIDPKVVELSNYNGIPHLLLPVVTDPKKAATALNWVVQEMTNRYKLFANTGVRNIDSYNEKINNIEGEEKLPKLVVIIDELADLMMVAPNQVEDAICRLAQMARAAGIHLIVATQRPSVDVITGVIKANIPSRIAFAVSSQADSRTILDMGGAEKLLGKGDMLFYPVGASKPVRVQGAFIADSEVKNIVDFIKNQVEDVDYEDAIIDNMEKSIQKENVDELLSQAIEIVVEAQQASISMLQRKLRIGYNRAARIIDEMENRGIVSGHLGSKPRNVLISKEELKEMKEKTS